MINAILLGGSVDDVHAWKKMSGCREGAVKDRRAISHWRGKWDTETATNLQIRMGEPESAVAEENAIRTKDTCAGRAPAKSRFELQTCLRTLGKASAWRGFAGVKAVYAAWSSSAWRSEVGK